MKFITVDNTITNSSIIINLDRVTHIDINTRSNTCKVYYSDKDCTLLSGNELAQLLSHLKDYNQQITTKLFKEDEF